MSGLAILAQANQTTTRLSEQATENMDKVYGELPSWMGNPFLTLVILGFVILAALAWLSFRQRRIAENQTRLANMMNDLADRMDEVLEELDRIE
jgi:hypothetical protein